MDNAGNAVGASFVVLGALWQVLAVVVLMVAAYVVLSMSLGRGVGTWRESMRRRRAAKHTSPESPSDD